MTTIQPSPLRVLAKLPPDPHQRMFLPDLKVGEILFLVSSRRTSLGNYLGTFQQTIYHRGAFYPKGETFQMLTEYVSEPVAAGTDDKAAEVAASRPDAGLFDAAQDLLSIAERIAQILDATDQDDPGVEQPLSAADALDELLLLRDDVAAAIAKATGRLQPRPV